MHIQINMLIKKIISMFTIGCFLFTSFSGKSYANTINTSYDIGNVFANMSVITSDFGKVTNINDVSSNITVINIQDLHCHKETQLNISRIIQSFDDNYNVKSVYAEGGYGNIDVGWVWQIDNEKFRDKIIDKLLDGGYLSGSEYYAIKKGKNDFLYGIEDESIHSDNLKRLSHIMQNQPLYSVVSDSVEREHNVLSLQYLNEKNKRFSRLLNNYTAGRTESNKFYKLLLLYVKKINKYPENYNNITAIKLQEYPNITAYVGMSKQYEGLNAKQVNVEMQKLIAKLRETISYGDYKKLLEKTNNFEDGEMLFEFISKFSEETNSDLLDEFRQLKKFLSVKRINQRVNPVKLIEEERRLIEQIRMALSIDETEYEIAYLLDFSIYFKDYLSYSLTLPDWQYFSSGFEKFYGLYKKYAVVDRILPLTVEMSELNKYYEINNNRNDIFLSNILKGVSSAVSSEVKVRTSEEILKNSNEIIIVVTGGYHSEELTKLLKDKKINSLTITPNVIGETKESSRKYAKIVKEQNAAIKSQALAFKLASCLTDNEQKILLFKAGAELLGITDFYEAAADLEKYGMKVLPEIVNSVKNANELNIEANNTFLSDEIKKILTDFISGVFSSKAAGLAFAPQNIIDKAIETMFNEFVKHGIYFSNGLVSEIEYSGIEVKDELFRQYDAVVLSRLPVFIQQAKFIIAQKQANINSLNNITNSKEAAKRLYDIWDRLTETERKRADEYVLKLYKNDAERQDLFLSNWSIADFRNETNIKMIKASQKRYEENEKAIPYNVVAASALITNKKLAEKISWVLSRINIWQQGYVEKYIYTVSENSVHMTFYTPVRFGSKLQKIEDLDIFKNAELKKQIIERIDLSMEDISGNKATFTEQNRKDICEIVESALVDELSKMEEEGFFDINKAPEFKIGEIGAFPDETSQESVIILHTAPKTGHDLAVLLKMQQRFQNRIGVDDYDIFNGHITLGYFINPIESEERFEALQRTIKDINADIQDNLSDAKYSLHVNPHVSHELPSSQSGITYSFKGELTGSKLRAKLDRKGITGEEREKVINKKENWIIVLGAAFNSVRNWFILQHKEAVTEEQKQELTHGMDKILAAAGINLPHKGFIRKIVAVIRILLDKKGKMAKLAELHTAWNNEKTSSIVNFVSDKTVEIVSTIMTNKIIIPKSALADAGKELSEEEKKQLFLYLSEKKSSIEKIYGKNPYEELEKEVNDIFNSLLDSMIATGKITKNEKEEYELIFFNSEEFEAYTIRGSKTVFISTGALAMLQEELNGFSKDHIASILAHELQHTIQLNRSREGFLSSLGSGKRKEYNSDIEALYIADNAGFNPKAFADVMQFLADMQNEESDKEITLSGVLILDPHPPSAERLNVINKVLNDKNTVFKNILQNMLPFESRLNISKRSKNIANALKNVSTRNDLKAVLNEYGNIFDILELLPVEKYNVVDFKTFLHEDIIEYQYSQYDQLQRKIIFELLFGEIFFDGPRADHIAIVHSMIDRLDNGALRQLKDFLVDYKIYPVSFQIKNNRVLYEGTGLFFWDRSAYADAFFYVSQKLNFSTLNADYDKLFNTMDIRNGKSIEPIDNYIEDMSLSKIASFMKENFHNLSENIQKDIVSALGPKSYRLIDDINERSELNEQEFEDMLTIFKAISESKQHYSLKFSFNKVTGMLLNYISKTKDKKKRFNDIKYFYKAIDVNRSDTPEQYIEQVFEIVKNSGKSVKEAINDGFIIENPKIFLKVYADEIENISDTEIDDIIDNILKQEPVSTFKSGRNDDLGRYIEICIDASLGMFVYIQHYRNGGFAIEYKTGIVTRTKNSNISYVSLVKLDEKWGYNNNQKKNARKFLRNIVQYSMRISKYTDEQTVRFSKYLDSEMAILTSKVPGAVGISMDDKDIADTPVEIIELFRHLTIVNNGKGDFELFEKWNRYAELKAWKANYDSSTDFEKEADRIAGHFHSAYRLREHEIENLFIFNMYKILGIDAEPESVKFNINFKNITEAIRSEEYEILWVEIKASLFDADINAARGNAILRNYSIIKKYMSTEQKNRFGNIIYSLLKKNQNLSSFGSVDENIELIDFLFESFSPAKDDHINEMFDKYEITPDMYDSLLKKMTTMSYSDDTKLTNESFMLLEILKTWLQSASNKDKSDLLLWLLGPDDKQEPDFLKKRSLSVDKEKNALNHKNLKKAFQTITSTERHEILSFLLGGQRGLLSGGKSDYKKFQYINYVRPTTLSAVFSTKYIQNMADDFENKLLSNYDLIAKVNSFYDVFIVPVAGNNNQRSGIFKEKNEIIKLINSGKSDSAKKRFIKILEDYLISEGLNNDTVIRQRLSTFFDRDEAIFISNNLYVFYDVLPVNFYKLDEMFSDYVRHIASDVSDHYGNYEKNLNQFYDLFVFPMYGENNKTLNDKKRILELSNSLYRGQSSSSRKQILNEMNLYFNYYQKNYDLKKLRNILENIFDIKNIFEEKHFSLNDKNPIFKFIEDDVLLLIRDIDSYEKTLEGIAEILFGKFGEHSGLMKNLFKVLLTAHEGEQKIVLLNDIINSFSSLGDTQNIARQKGMAIASMGSNAGIAVVKILQIVSNNKGFEDIFEGNDGKVINEEVAKLKSSNDPLLKSTMFRLLNSINMLDKIKSIGRRIGSASIAQAHVITLADGRKMVGKFKRPSAVKRMDKDIEMMNRLKKFFLDNVEKFSDFPVPETNKIAEIIFEELQFGKEKSAMVKIAENIKNRDAKIKVPSVEANSSEDVLLQEFVDGTVLGEKKLGKSKSGIYFNILREFFDEVFIDGFYHADLHDGNIIIDKKNNIWFIDFGAHGEIKNKSPGNLNALKKLFMASYGKKFDDFIKALKTYNNDMYLAISSNPQHQKELKRIFKSSKTAEEVFMNLFKFIEKNLDMDNEFLMFFQGLSKIGKYLDYLTVSDKLKLLKIFSEPRLSEKAILPENLKNVNEQMQQGKAVWRTALMVAFAEVNDSLKSDFVERHKTEAGRAGAQKISDFLSKWLTVADRISKRSVILKDAIRNIIIGVSIIKHAIIDYKHIKSTGLKEAIDMFGKDVWLDEDGEVHIPPVLIVDDVSKVRKEHKLVNTGLKLDGNTVWKIDSSGVLVYAVEGDNVKEAAKLLNSSRILQNEIRKKIGHNITVSAEAVVSSKNVDGMMFEDGITLFGIDELQRSGEDLIDFIGAAIAEKKAVGYTIRKKVFIWLDTLEGEDFKDALENGEGTKVINKKQYQALRNELISINALSKSEQEISVLLRQKIMNLRESGIEVYLLIDEQVSNRAYMSEGFVGHVYNNKVLDYYIGEETEIEKLENENISLSALESLIVTSKKPLLVKIKTLKNILEKERDITLKYGILGSLLGNIKIKFGVGDLSEFDLKRLAYNIDFEKIPDMLSSNREAFAKMTDEELSDMQKLEDILNIDGNDIISITFKNLSKKYITNKTKNLAELNKSKIAFMTTLRETMLSKLLLKEKGKEYGLKDKQMELLLGKMIVAQVYNDDKTTIAISDNFRGGNMIAEVAELDISVGELDEQLLSDFSGKKELKNERELAVNTIIELILVYADEYKSRQLIKSQNYHNTRGFRAMLSAA